VFSPRQGADQGEVADDQENENYDEDDGRGHALILPQGPQRGRQRDCSYRRKASRRPIDLREWAPFRRIQTRRARLTSSDPVLYVLRLWATR
jgi:hypothetical protein